MADLNLLPTRSERVNEMLEERQRRLFEEIGRGSFVPFSAIQNPANPCTQALGDSVFAVNPIGDALDAGKRLWRWLLRQFIR